MRKLEKPIAAKWLTVKQAADYLGCHRSFLDHDRSSGNKISYLRIGRHIRYSVADLDFFMESSKVLGKLG